MSERMRYRHHFYHHRLICARTVNRQNIYAQYSKHCVTQTPRFVETCHLFGSRLDTFHHRTINQESPIISSLSKPPVVFPSRPSHFASNQPELFPHQICHSSFEHHPLNNLTSLAFCTVNSIASIKPFIDTRRPIFCHHCPFVLLAIVNRVLAVNIGCLVMLCPVMLKTKLKG